MNYKLILSLSTLLATSAFAQTTEQDSIKKIKELNEIVIDGSRETTSKISKNGISEMDLPQAVSILSYKTIEQQQIANLTDVLKNANGIYIMGNTGGYQEEIASRGSSISSTNTFKNGIRFFNGMKIEMSGVDKIEILKGNSAIEYGNVAPGGVLNIVTKKPKFNFGGNVGLTYGSFNTFKPQFDIYGALNKSKTIAFRLNSSYQKGNSFRKYVNSENIYVNPSLLFKLSEKSTLLVEGDYSKNSTVPDFGTGIINYEIVEIPRDRFTGVSWGRYNAQQSLVSAKYNLQISNNWNLSALVGYRNYATELFANTRPASTSIKPNGDWSRGIQKSQIGDNYTIQQVDANAQFSTGKIKHQVLIGADAEQFETKTTAFNNITNYDQINIFEEYNSSVETAEPSLTENTKTTNTVNRYGIYAQNLISFPKYFKILIGARYNAISSKSNVYSYKADTNTLTETNDNPISPKVGLIFQPTKNHTIFTSYSNSFSLNTGIDVNGNALKASVINQYEAGIKNRLFDGKLQANATVYQITNSNLAQTSLANGNTNSNIKELAGETNSKGLELDLVYKPNTNLSVLLGYSFNETKFTKSNIYVIGSELRYNPKNTANLSINYEFTEGALQNFNIGLISQYFGKRYAGRSTRLTVANDSYQLIALNEYYVLDIVAGYSYKKWKLNAKVANVLNQNNYNVHDDNSLNPITPTNFTLQLGFTF
ncbi:MAG: TonB-dependent receptor [Bacteroidota bacterium]